MPVFDEAGIIALAFIAVLGTLLILSMVRYPKVEDFMKVWGGIAIILTAIVTYFFTSHSAQQRIAKAEKERDDAVAQLNAGPLEIIDGDRLENPKVVHVDKPTKTPTAVAMGPRKPGTDHVFESPDHKRYIIDAMTPAPENNTPVLIK